MASVSVIIPCHNSEAFVKRAIDSVLRQSFKDVELLLIDNNSTDSTLAILRQYAETHPSFIRLFEEPREGAPFARNRGLAEATSDWLQFLDSDDELMEHKIEQQFQITKQAQPDLVVGGFIVCRDGASEAAMEMVRLKAQDPWKGLIESKLGKTSSLLWRKEAVVAAGGWNESMTSSQEYDLLFRMLKNGAKISFADSAETIHYIRKNSISHSGSKTRIVEILNNYVDLRMAIKNHLVSEGKFSKDLRHAMATSVYFKLYPYKKRVPEYWKTKLDETGLRLPFRYWVGQQVKKARLWWTDTKRGFNFLKAS